jgi:uncharacterized membrane protein YqjE
MAMDSFLEARTVGRSSGMLDAARRLLAAVWAHAEIRMELLSVELAEERSRVMNAIVAAGLMIVFAALTFAFIGVGVLLAAWDTPYRMAASVAVPAVFAIAGFIAWMSLRKLIGRESPLFRHSLAEWRRDVEAIRNPPDASP